MSKNAEGWIRHNSKQQPVDDHVAVEIRTRGGDYEICEASGFAWNATEENQIMAYRLHKPAEQVVNMEAFSDCVNAFGDSHADVMASVLSRIEGPFKWRDRITEIDATTQALTTERAELVQKLASEGFALIGRINELLTDAEQKHEAQQPDPGRWMIGDSVECVSSSYSFITVGTIYKITGFDRNMVQFLDDDGEEMDHEREHFKFHSRPSA